jgi:hypothetical protein
MLVLLPHKMSDYVVVKKDNIVFNNNNIILADFNNINRHFMTIGSA